MGEVALLNPPRTRSTNQARHRIVLVACTSFLVPLADQDVASTWSNLLAQDVHTPIPYTPIPFEQGQLVMTPDTPAFEMSSLEMSLAGAKRTFDEDGLETMDAAISWTEDEDGILQSVSTGRICLQY